MKYPKPKLFVPTLADKQRIGKIIASNLTPSSGVVVAENEILRGSKKIKKC